MTEEDRLLRDLGRLARREKESEQAHLDERWDRLAAGTLTAEEEAELLALAATSPEAREALEAFRPLGAEFQARVVAAVAAELRTTAGREARREPRPRPSAPRRNASRRWGWRWLVPAAAAAAAALLLLLRSPTTLPPLPTYTAELSGEIQMQRGGEPGAPSDTPVFAPGGQLKLVVNPAVELLDVRRLAARAFISPQKGLEDFAPWTPESSFEIGGNGRVRLLGTLGEDIHLSPGAWTVWIVVGRKGRMPSASELQAELLGGRPQISDWKAVCLDLLSQWTRSTRPWQTTCANLLVEDQPPS